MSTTATTQHNNPSRRAVTGAPLAAQSPVTGTPPSPTAETSTTSIPGDRTHGVHPLTFGRALTVELRKMIDTRAGMILPLAAALMAGAVSGGTALFAKQPTTVDRLATMAAWPAGLFAMIMATLLVTGEFSQRTASVTFTLDPRRDRVLAAKTGAVLVLALVAGALSLLCGMLVGLVAPAAGGPAVTLALTGPQAAIITGTLGFMALAGLAWGMATRNAPAALVVVLVWPTLAMLISQVSPQAAEVLAWIDQNAVLALDDGIEHAWAKLATATLAWIILPGAVGAWRLVRRDI